MFIRKKKNKSGVISIQIITKLKRKSILIKTIGSSNDEIEAQQLVKRAQEFIDTYAGQQTLDFPPSTKFNKNSF